MPSYTSPKIPSLVPLLLRLLSYFTEKSVSRNHPCVLSYSFFRKLVEGAGGWFTPLSDTFTFADWVTQEQLPVILVVGVKLGCINHAMLTAQAILHAGLTLAGWVANDVTPPGKRHAEYMTTLTRMIPAPLLGEIPWLAENPENAATGKYINLALM